MSREGNAVHHVQRGQIKCTSTVQHSLWNNWVCCCKAGEDFGGYWRREGIGDCRLNVATQQLSETCKFHSGNYQEQCYKQAEKVFILLGLGLGRHLFPFLQRKQHFKGAVDQLEGEEIIKMCYKAESQGSSWKN